MTEFLIEKHLRIYNILWHRGPQSHEHTVLLKDLFQTVSVSWLSFSNQKQKLRMRSVIKSNMDNHIPQLCSCSSKVMKCHDLSPLQNKVWRDLSYVVYSQSTLLVQSLTGLCSSDHTKGRKEETKSVKHWPWLCSVLRAHIPIFKFKNKSHGGAVM